MCTSLRCNIIPISYNNFTFKCYPFKTISKYPFYPISFIYLLVFPVILVFPVLLVFTFTGIPFSQFSFLLVFPFSWLFPGYSLVFTFTSFPLVFPYSGFSHDWFSTLLSPLYMGSLFLVFPFPASPLYCFLPYLFSAVIFFSFYNFPLIFFFFNGIPFYMFPLFRVSLFVVFPYSCF